MENNQIHWLIVTNQLCPLLTGKPTYIKNGFSHAKVVVKKRPMVSQPIDHLILEGLSTDEILKQMDLSNISMTRAKDYIYERKRNLGYRRKSKQMEALELMKDKKLTDQDIADRLGMHKRYVRYLRVQNSRGRL